MQMTRAGMAGDETYDAYVGPPDQYDFMGATQFRLLTTFGLREHHRVLDVGCGSLRLGRLLLPYLNPECYYGIEPNAWLIEAAKEKEIGQSQFDLKRPTFDGNAQFEIPFDTEFDFVVAQSIFSHTGLSLFNTAMRNIVGALTQDGLLFATFVQYEDEAADDHWYYPGCVGIHHRAILRVARDNGLHCRRLKWFHPRQTWYLFSKNKGKLPSYREARHCSGEVLNCPDIIRARREMKVRRAWYLFRRHMPGFVVRFVKEHAVPAWKRMIAGAHG